MLTSSQSILKNCTYFSNWRLLVDDEPINIQKLKNALGALSAKVLTASNGQEALNIIKDSNIDLVISDISMPIMDGINLLEEIRKFDEELDFIFITAYEKPEYLIKAIEHKTLNYFLKPIDLNQILPKIVQVAYKKNHGEINELSILKEISIISKTDLKGRITYINDAFCDVSGYTREELIGQSHNIVRHKDTPNSTFKDLWDTIKSKQIWKGKVKNQSKDGSTFYFNTTVYPILDPVTSQIKEYMSVRFLITEEENKYKELNKNMIKAIADQKKSQFKIQELETKIDQIQYLEQKYHNEKKRSSSLNSQVSHYEDQLKNIKSNYEGQINKLREQLNIHSQDMKDTKDKNKLFEKQLEAKNKTEQLHKKEIAKLNDQVVNQNKKITDLQDVINSYEKQIKELKEQQSIVDESVSKESV